MTKLKFRVVHFSSEDSGYPADELNVHSPSTRGWQSAKFCQFPQEIGIELLGGESRLTQLQILSHQSKIATKIEIFVGRGKEYNTAAYKRLGYLTLDSNERSSYQARELKTVYVDHAGKFVRLLVHQNFVNKQNLFNQVGVVAVNLLGGEDVVGPVSSSSPRQHSQYSPMRGDKAVPSFNNQLNDLSIDMNLDPQTAAKLRQLVDAKSKAVANEDYATAKRIKEVEGELKTLGSQLAQLDIAKKRAVADEDYDRAKDLKDQGDALRAEIGSKILAVRIPGVTDTRPMQPARAAAPKSLGQHTQSKLSSDDNYDDHGYNNDNNGGGYDAIAAPPRVQPANGRGVPLNIDDMPVGGGHGRGPSAGYPGSAGPKESSPVIAARGGARGQAESPMKSPYNNHQPQYEQEHDQDHENDQEGSYDIQNQQQQQDFSPGGGERPIRPKPTTTYDDKDPFIGETDEGNDGGGFENFPPGQHPLEGVHNFAELGHPEEIIGKSRETAETGGITNLVGEYRARCLFSKTWALRDAVLTKIMMMLTGHHNEGRETDEVCLIDNPGIAACLPALAQVVRVGVDDKIQQVLYGSVALLEAVLAATRKAKLPRSTVAPVFETTVACLVERLADGNARMREGAHKGLDILAGSTNVGPAVVGAHLLRAIPSKQATAWRPILARLTVLKELVASYGVGGNSISWEAAMNFGKTNSVFGHSNAEVRDAARDLTVAIQKHVGTPPLESYLQTLRTKQLEEYMAAFDGISPAAAAAALKKAPSGDAGSKQTASSGKGGGGGGGGKVNTSAVRAAEKEPARGGAGAAGAKGDKDKQSHVSPKKGGTKAGGAGGKEGRAAAAKDAEGEEEEYEEEKFDEEATDFTKCMFCEEANKGWNEDALDLHYWKDCPLLSPCPACAQVVEIAGLPEHLLDECEQKANYVPCDVTGLAIRADEMDDWRKSSNCVPPPTHCMYCPLCFASVEDSNEAWKDHLMTGCPQNTRTRRK